MANDLIYVRVLQHDTEDMIRIGMAIPVWNNQLDKKLEKEWMENCSQETRIKQRDLARY